MLRLLAIFLWTAAAVVLAPGEGTAPARQFEGWRWTEFTMESGLPSNNITALAESPDGRVWAGTTSGLAWFDGYRWNAIDTSLGLPRRSILAIYPMRGDSIYVLLQGMVCLGSTAGFRRLPLEGILDAVLLGNRDLLVSANRALYRYHDGVVTPLERFPELSKGELTPLRRTRNGQIYLNALHGLYRWEGGEWKLFIPAAASGRTIVASIADGEGGKSGFISIDLPIELRGLWRWNSGSDPSLRKVQDAVNFMAMAVDEKGVLLGITNDGGPIMRTGAREEMVDFNQSQIEDIHLLCYSRNGSLWIGTADGLFYYNATVERWRFWKHSLLDPHNNVNEIIRTHDGAIWLATEGGVEIHKPDGTVTQMDAAGADRLQILTGMAEDADGNVWVSSGASLRGAYRWNGRRWDHFDLGDNPRETSIHKIRRDRQGRLWFLGLAGDYSPLSQVDKPGAFLLSKGKFVRWGKPEGLLSGRVYSFTQAPDSALWFGTLGGVSRWKNGRWTYWTLKDGLIFQNVFALAADDNGRVWFAGQTPALGYIEHDSVHFLSPSAYPIHGNIWDLRVDGSGTLWISARNEIIAFRDSTWLTYGASSGLGKAEAWPILPLEHEVYVGTHGNGAAILNLRELRPPYPRIYMDKPLVENESVLLRWRSLAYWGEISPKNVQSRFRIDGGSWSDWDVRSEVSLENLDPGSHTALVQAKGLLGNFGPGAEKEFSIEAPWYGQAVFFVPVSVSVAMIGGLGLMLILRKRRHAAELRQSEMKFRRLTEATFEGIALHDGGVIIDANQSILEMFGYGYDEFVGRNVLDIAAPESKETIRQIMISENERPSEAMGVTKNGARIFLEIIGKMIPYDKRSVGVVAIRDITERKQTEERLLMYQKQLRSLAQELSMTEEHERRQMATYLHDTIGQALAFCKIKLGQIEEAGSSSELQEVRKLIEETLKNAQSLTFELSPPILYELSFEEAVEWLCEHHQKQHRLAVHFETDDHPRPLPNDVRIILYNAVRELLVNVVKHSGARTASVVIRHGERQLAIVVSDDGSGFPPQRPATITNHGGFGLFNIRERLAHLGGRLQIDSMAGKGVAVTISLPFED